MTVIEQRAQASLAKAQAANLTCEKAAAMLWSHVGKPGVLNYLTNQDVRDLAAVVNCLEAGDRNAAMRAASLLETAVREEIPLAVWAFIGGELVHG